MLTPVYIIPKHVFADISLELLAKWNDADILVLLPQVELMRRLKAEAQSASVDWPEAPKAS